MIALGPQQPVYRCGYGAEAGEPEGLPPALRRSLGAQMLSNFVGPGQGGCDRL